MKNKLKLAYCLALFLCFSTQIANAQQTLYPQYNGVHECSDNRAATTGICGLLNKVRHNGPVANNSSLPAAIMAVHRGLWADGVPENTSEAFRQTAEKGYKLIEADIMPANITNYTNPNGTNFGKPGGLVCFHDFKLQRMTNSTDNAYVFQKTVSQLQAIQLKKPRSNQTSNWSICSLLTLINIAADNNVIACLDIKNLENNGNTELTQWSTTDRKLLSLTENIKWALNNIPQDKLKYVAIKTYEKYSDLKSRIAPDTAPADIKKRFNSILWIPMIAKNDKSITNGVIDVSKVNSWLRDWGAVNKAVLYYEVNIFSDNDVTNKLLEPLFLSTEMNNSAAPVCKAINTVYNRRVGIFSEEPVGSKGTVNRWGKWSYKKPKVDRRGDPHWLLKDIPEMKKGVITTDRPDHWKDLTNYISN